MNREIITHLPTLKQQLSHIIQAWPLKDLPKTLVYQKDVSEPKYEIIIQTVEEKFFIDSKGRKWLRADDDED